jgi:hypothetical protein
MDGHFFSKKETDNKNEYDMNKNLYVIYMFIYDILDNIKS